MTGCLSAFQTVLLAVLHPVLYQERCYDMVWPLTTIIVDALGFNHLWSELKACKMSTSKSQTAKKVWDCLLLCSFLFHKTAFTGNRIPEIYFL